MLNTINHEERDEKNVIKEVRQMLCGKGNCHNNKFSYNGQSHTYKTDTVRCIIMKSVQNHHTQLPVNITVAHA